MVQRATDTVQHATDTVQHATATVRQQVTAEMIKRKPPDNSKGGDRRSYEIVVDVSGAPAHKARRGICKARRGIYKVCRGIDKVCRGLCKAL